MYPNDFAPEPPPPLIDPTLLAMLVLLVVALVAFALWLGQHLEGRAQERRGTEAAKELWKAVAKAAHAANAARGDDLIGKAGALRQTVEDRLGPVLVVAGPLVSRFDALKNALEGKACAADDHSEHGHGDHEAHEAGGSTISIHQPRKVVIRNGEPAHGGHGGHEHPPAADPRVSPREVRAAVTAFREWWGEEGARVRELRRAQAALNGGPLPK